MQLPLMKLGLAAKKYIDPNSWTWVIVGDLSIIEEDIKNLNIGPVEIIEL